MRRMISTPLAPRAIGPYSQALQVDKTLYISGQLGIDPTSGALVQGGLAAQTKQALQNIQAILTAADFSLADVVQVQIFLTNIADFPAVNEVYKQFFNPPYPARATVAVAGLPAGAAVEIMVVAVKD